MTFSTSGYLRKATSRAKSDVANKLVSIFLHGLSRKITVLLRANVTDEEYAEAVAAEFGSNCCYCGVMLELDRASVEHLEGMNRFQLGLHIPGNVLVACKRCNGEKRRDDQLHECILATSGWESFLCHDSVRCAAGCKTCAYWTRIWPDANQRAENLQKARAKISAFRSRYPESVEWSRKVKALLRPELDKLYRDCQEFATVRITASVEQLFSRLRE